MTPPLQLDANIWGTFCSPDVKCSLCCNGALYNVHLQRLLLRECDFMTDKSSSDDAE